MIDFITPVNKLFEEAKEIQAFAEVTLSDNIQEIVERINDYSIYIARTGKMLADAKYHLNAKKKDGVMEVIKELVADKKLSANTQNSIIDNICRNEHYLVDWLERLNRACVHNMEVLRSLLSYEKENLRITKTGY